VGDESTIAASAHRNGIDNADTHHAFDHLMWIEDLDDGLLMVIGPDTTGRLLERGIVDGASGPVIIHAVHGKYLR
jgi:hypothetical protein